MSFYQGKIKEHIPLKTKINQLHSSSSNEQRWIRNVKTWQHSQSILIRNKVQSLANSQIYNMLSLIRPRIQAFSDLTPDLRSNLKEQK